MIKVGINGFGRIGRMVFRAAAQFPDIEIVGVNDLLEADYLAYMLMYDSVHGRFNGDIKVDGNTLLVNGKKVRLTAEKDPATLKWGEVGADVQKAVRGGLLHDIGKGIEMEGGGGHALIGADLARMYGEDEDTVNMIASHHGDREVSCVEAVLVTAADAISAARPGARKESLEGYVKRLENLEKIANDFKGVEKSFAIQAGRELRVMVHNDQVDDEAARQIARDIAKRIEREIKHPGVVKITVIRETRIVEHAY